MAGLRVPIAYIGRNIADTDRVIACKPIVEQVIIDSGQCRLDQSRSR